MASREPRALDPRALRPAELARLLNSTPLGEVVRSHVIYRQRNRAGYRIGDGKTIDLVRYAAWLAGELHAREPEEEPGGYEAMKERARARNAQLSAAGRDIAPLPEVVDPDREERATGDFRYFCEAYFPQTSHLDWSTDHLKVLGRIEDAVLRVGGGVHSGHRTGRRPDEADPRAGAAQAFGAEREAARIDFDNSGPSPIMATRPPGSYVEWRQCFPHGEYRDQWLTSS